MGLSVFIDFLHKQQGGGGGGAACAVNDTGLLGLELAAVHLKDPQLEQL